jgi:transcriptional regulator with XRE-family HTH domain
MASANLNPLGMYITRRRTRRNWSMAELGRQADVPYGTLRNIEQKTLPVKPLETTIRKLAAALAEKGQEQEELDMLLALAGYGIPISQSAEVRQHTLDVLLESHPEWKKELLVIQNEMTPAQQDQALQALRVFNRMQMGKD